MMKPVFAFIALLLPALVSAAANPDHVSEIEAWRKRRVERLTAPDGWLTLTGLHFLKEGDNTVGSAAASDVVLAKGPDRLGTVTVAADGRVSIALAPGVDATFDGQRRERAELHWHDTAKPTTVRFGTVSFFVIDRSGRKALRVKDSESAARTQFLGLDYFPVDLTWRIEARWVAFEKPRRLPIPNVLGQTTLELVPGKAVFEREGRTFELLAIDEDPREPLFFVIADATSGHETYAAARFLYAERPRNGTIVLDFNRAYNPPCAFTPFATCPLPPRENRLPIPVRAGEKKYRGGHE